MTEGGRAHLSMGIPIVLLLRRIDPEEKVPKNKCPARQSLYLMDAT